MMKRQVSPVVAVIVVVAAVVILAFVGYKLFLEPEKPRWSPTSGYGAPGYGRPMNAPSLVR